MTTLAVWLETRRACLRITGGSAQGVEYAIDQERVTLGRGPGVDLAFDDPLMSREHAVLEWTRHGFRLVDLGSTNGTRLNNAPVERSALKDGDQIAIGAQVFRFVEEARGAGSRP